jgi:hypothetical protein
LFAHDLFGKPLHTFPGHALKAHNAVRLIAPGVIEAKPTFLGCCQSTTLIGQGAAHPVAFAVVLVYSVLWIAYEIQNVRERAHD